MKYFLFFMAGIFISAFFGFLAYVLKPSEVRQLPPVVQTIKEDCTHSQAYEQAFNEVLTYIESLPKEELYFLCHN